MAIRDSREEKTMVQYTRTVHNATLFLSLILHQHFLLRGTIVLKELVQNPRPVLNVENTLNTSLQRFHVVYHGKPTSEFCFPIYRRALRRVCIPRKYKVTSRIFHGVYHEIVLHNYYKPCHGKYSGQHNQYDIRAAHDGKVGWNTVESTTTFQYSDWLYFYGTVQVLISPRGRFSLPSS